MPYAGDADQGWLDLTHVALPLGDERGADTESVPRGWRAAPGPQSIRARFEEPRQIRRIRIAFEEQRQPRTQEFALRWSADGRVFHQLVRQQYVFSPPETTVELETYEVDLVGVREIELVVVPDISGSPACVWLSALLVDPE